MVYQYLYIYAYNRQTKRMHTATIKINCFIEFKTVLVKPSSSSNIHTLNFKTKLSHSKSRFQSNFQPTFEQKFQNQKIPQRRAFPSVYRLTAISDNFSGAHNWDTRHSITELQKPRATIRRSASPRLFLRACIFFSLSNTWHRTNGSPGKNISPADAN